MFLRRFLSIFVLVCFMLTTVTPMQRVCADNMLLPKPGSILNLSQAFEPVLIKGLKIHPENPFKFDFILDAGHSGMPINSAAFKTESNRLIKYFLAAMTIPEKDLWVNLSPYEKNRMIAKNLGQTQMGADMLAQDYVLKQLTASLIYPEKGLGKKFWDKVYAETQEKFGNVQIPVNTFNKVWIVADKADVFERGQVAFISAAHLKVMIEEDYLATSKNTVGAGLAPAQNNRATASVSPTKEIIREIILPAIEREVNEGKNFAPLRQMFYSMILASWYKMALKDAMLTKVYGNQSKVKGSIEQKDTKTNQDIYEHYLQAYKKGVFNYIKEDPSTGSGQVPVARKYFSGGLNIFQGDPARVVHRTSQVSDFTKGNFAMATVNVEGVHVNGREGDLTADLVAEIAQAGLTTTRILYDYQKAYPHGGTPYLAEFARVAIANAKRKKRDENAAMTAGVKETLDLYREKEIKDFFAGDKAPRPGDHLIILYNSNTRDSIDGQFVSFIDGNLTLSRLEGDRAKEREFTTGGWGRTSLVAILSIIRKSSPAMAATIKIGSYDVRLGHTLHFRIQGQSNSEAFDGEVVAIDTTSGRISLRDAKGAVTVYNVNQLSVEGVQVPKNLQSETRSGRLKAHGKFEMLSDEKTSSDPALIADVDGGIDLKSTQINRQKQGSGVQFNFSAGGGSAFGGDAAQMTQIKMGNFDGLDFRIDSIVPIVNLPMALGLS